MTFLSLLNISIAFGPCKSKNSPIKRSTLNMKVALFYGTSTGNTENVASIFDDLSSEIDLVTYIDDFEDENAYDGL